MAARAEGVDVSVSSLCIASGVPATTALRWIRTMTQTGMIRRAPDPGDARRVFLALSEKSAQAMAAYLASRRRMLAGLP